MSMKFGMTYGNATREILKTDPSLKKGELQQEIARRMLKNNVPLDLGTAVSTTQDKYVWERRNTYATGDDRFSFPPVPGYTGNTTFNNMLGYIPRSQDHFGRPFVETTNAALMDFQKMTKSKNTLPPRIRAIQISRIKKEEAGKGTAVTTDMRPPVHNCSFDPYSQPYTDEMSPYKLPKDHPQKTFISGYTGFVPRLQHHFGEPYPNSVRQAIDDFVQSPPTENPYVRGKKTQKRQPKVVMTKPIPGFTGFIPGSRTCYSMSFGKTSEVAYDQFNHRDEKGRMPTLLPAMPPKDLSKTIPISGYRGHKTMRA
ncbi:hypothetical protein HDV02_000209 [Globomyces sp. JEL0801]|nr:hypothetical protein HDV02_000209 [Globomyces sp. JEL0801]